MLRPSRLLAAAFAATLLLPAGHASADAIDGDWCFRDGKRFSIAGSTIVTPGDTRMTGVYSRHFFEYVVPVGEKPAGIKINMSLVDEDTIHLTVGAVKDKVQVWKRCRQPIS